MAAQNKLFGKDLSQYEELDIDDLLEQLSPEELEMLAGEADPDVSKSSICHSLLLQLW